MKKLIPSLVLGLLLVFVFGHSSISQNVDPDTQQIIQVVSQGIPPGDQKFKVYTSNMSRSGSYVYIGTTYDHIGETFLLKKVNEQWSILASDGGVFNDENMIELGVPSKHAKELWRQWNQNNK